MSEHRSDVRKDDIQNALAIVNGYQRTCLAAAAVQLGIFDKLAEGDETLDRLAADLGLHRGALARLLRALNAIGLVDQQGDRACLTGSARLFLKGGFSSALRAWAILTGGEYLALWGRLADSVRTGEAVFERVFNCSPWKHRQDSRALNDAFNEVTSAEQLRTSSMLLRAYDFGGHRCVVDVGGGHGNLVVGVLKKHPHMHGIVFDLPHVVSGAEARVAAAGVGDRCQVVGGSFLESVPCGADVQILKHVLHNWDDDNGVRILRNARKALDPGGRLLIVEDVVGSDIATAAPVVMLDIHMLVVHGGRERTLAEYDRMLSDSGFSRVRHMVTRPGVPDVIEAAPI